MQRTFFRTAAMWLAARLYAMEHDGARQAEQLGALLGELDAAAEMRIIVREAK